ncbi:MAG: fumarylacetoacetate hydrolase family protein [Bryobacteraceae bacterium]|nr:fumarylacetoacetate hydrolase family protein [Bryobacteraceae bacterium]
MKLLRFRHAGAVDSGVLLGGRVIPFGEVNARRGTALPRELPALIQGGDLTPLRDLRGLEGVPLADVTPLLPYESPPKIWCIGLNYHSHAVDINAVQPEEPGSFMKPSSCLFQPGGDIVLPPPEVSSDVDAEGELGVVIGRRCRFVPAEHVREVIFGYTKTLDLTALDVLARNTRYLTRAKSIDTFLSFGPVIVTAGEVQDVGSLRVTTMHNGQVWSSDFVRHMRHAPDELVRFHSDYFTLEPGDLISTGCPKGARIKAGDRVAADIEGIGRLEANVRQGSREPLY